MIFPVFRNKKLGYVNLNIEAGKWIADKKDRYGKNPFLDSAICQKMINDANKKYNLDFSFGGWMEDRSFIWKGCYMEQKKTYTHLGLDLNVPAGTEVAATFDAKVIRADTDSSRDCGWGTRVILRHWLEPLYFIYAHLDKDIKCQVGDSIPEGKVFAKVGKPPYNGNWFEHLHLQTIAEEYFEELERKNLWAELDGYGAESEIGINAKRFPDPVRFIFGA